MPGKGIVLLLHISQMKKALTIWFVTSISTFHKSTNITIKVGQLLL